MTPAGAEPMVVYDDVSKFFAVRGRISDDKAPELMVALDRVTAAVRKGEFVTLLGPSAAARPHCCASPPG